MSSFNKLNKIDCSEKVEEKNGFNYLSWAWAWQEAKKNYPDMKRVVSKSPDGNLYFSDGKFCWVEVTIIIEGVEETDYLPVMDYRNKPIPLDKVDSFVVNTAIQRSTVKALALHGLGLYIYAGEDLPEKDAKKKGEIEIITKQIANCVTKIELDKIWNSNKQHQKVTSIRDCFQKMTDSFDTLYELENNLELSNTPNDLEFFSQESTVLPPHLKKEFDNTMMLKYKELWSIDKLPISNADECNVLVREINEVPEKYITMIKKIIVQCAKKLNLEFSERKGIYIEKDTLQLS